MNHRWQVKCLIDTGKAIVPAQRQLRLLKDRVLGYEREPNKDRNTIRDGLDLIHWLGNIAGAKVLEIGTGWQPMIPILFSLAGTRTYMTDLHRLMREDTFSATLVALRESREEIAKGLHISLDEVDHVTRDCRNMEERLQELHLQYVAPCDCRRLYLEAGSIDIVTSRAVLEHVPPPVIAGMFREAKRILRPGGIMLHLVDHSDHWAHRDRSISAINFLRYPDWQFRLTCINPQNYQNRLRHSEYVAMLRGAGFVLKREQRTVDPTCVSILQAMPIAERFRRFDKEDLATTRSILLAESLPVTMSDGALPIEH